MGGKLRNGHMCWDSSCKILCVCLAYILCLCKGKSKAVQKVDCKLCQIRRHYKNACPINKWHRPHHLGAVFSVWTSCSSCALRIQILENFGKAQLTVDFYNTTCPDVDLIVKNAIGSMANQSNVVPPSTLRLLVHDCFVEGCDASILISSTSANSAERDHPDNNIPQMAFDAIIQAKRAVEAACPGVVSCADILAMAARDSVVLTGGPHWDVPKGRRDGMISQASRVRLPGSDFNLTQLMDIFQSMNLTATDLVVLSGGHTIGFSHCNQFSKRLYNYDGQNMTDPSMNSSFAQNLMAECPKGGDDPGKVEAFDVSTPFGFDNAYFKNLQLGQGLLFADQVLFTENLTRQVVNELAASQDEFFTSFVSSMIKMSSIGLKTGQDGEIRSDCTAFNSNQSLPNSRGS